MASECRYERRTWLDGPSRDQRLAWIREGMRIEDKQDWCSMMEWNAPTKDAAKVETVVLPLIVGHHWVLEIDGKAPLPRKRRRNIPARHRPEIPDMLALDGTLILLLKTLQKEIKETLARIECRLDVCTRQQDKAQEDKTIATMRCYRNASYTHLVLMVKDSQTTLSKLEEIAGGVEEGRMDMPSLTNQDLPEQVECAPCWCVSIPEDNL